MDLGKLAEVEGSEVVGGADEEEAADGATDDRVKLVRGVVPGRPSMITLERGTGEEAADKEETAAVAEEEGRTTVECVCLGSGGG